MRISGGMSYRYTQICSWKSQRRAEERERERHTQSVCACVRERDTQSVCVRERERPYLASGGRGADQVAAEGETGGAGA